MMSKLRLITLPMLAATATATFASTDTSPINLAVTPIAPTGQAHDVVNAASNLLGRPTLGLRIGGGEWKEFVINGGADVTLKVPFLPLPALRLDAEVWAKPANTSDRHGNAVSLLGIQTFLLGYAGIGPSYYFTDDEGDHRSGFGVKALAGLNLPDSAFVEASVILGESPAPVFVSIGKRF